MSTTGPGRGGARDLAGTPAGARRGLALATLCVGLLLVSLDSTVLNVALPTLVRRLHASASELQWMVDAYELTFAGLLLVLGNLADRLGRRRLLVAGLALFAAGSAASAFAVTPDRLVAARAVMGVGAAAIMPATLSILADLFPEPAERARAIGAWSATTGLGVAIGPALGGWLLGHFWWGSVFLVNVPVALAGLAAAVAVVPESRDPVATPPDPLGAILATVGTGSLLWGIIESATHPWRSAAVAGAMLLGAGLLGAFACWERRVPGPMLDVAFFASRRFSAAVLAMALVLFGLIGGLFLLTQYLQFSLGYSPLATGLRVVPVAALLAAVAALSSPAVRAIGTKAVVVAGMSCIAAGFALLSRTTASGTYRDVLPAFLLLGAGAGLALAPCTDSVIGSLPPGRVGVGSATNSTALETGGALGVAVLGSLLGGRYGAAMAPVARLLGAPAPVVHTAAGSLGGALGVAARLPGPPGFLLERAARDAFVAGLDLAMLVGAAVIGVAALVVAAFLPGRAPAGPVDAVPEGGLRPEPARALSGPSSRRRGPTSLPRS